MTRIATLCLLAGLSAVVPELGLAQSSDMNKKDTKGMDMKGMDMKSMDMKDMGTDKKATTTAHSGTGVVKSIDTANDVVTLVHEPLKTLNWPAMTMSFKVKDKTLLNQVKPGDKVRFTVVQAGKDYVITSMK